MAEGNAEGCKMAMAVKRRQWLGEEMHGVWSGGCQPARTRGRPKKTWREIL